ncbi:MAG: hypothetical protein N2049_08425 [Anaerolineales bacterium]|nr:hypothetical protein [Anaerolineales bacterium]MCX7609224.1 hypothetical protein [Anaerolineales bacterium]MDW8226169.1 DMT family transporter [Anaerolineales bacterium]
MLVSLLFDLSNWTYLFGLLCGFLSGVMNALGVILEKDAVNRLSAEQRASGVMKALVRSSRWWAGIACGFGFGTVFLLTAQQLIGPALVPALTASSMIVLALASTRLLDEHLRPLECLGVLAMLSGMVLLGRLRLDIPAEHVALFAPGLLLRLTALSLTLGALWAFVHLAALRLNGQLRGFLLAVSSGLPFAISNLWILPLLLTMGAVFAGTANGVQTLLFLLSCLILVGTNIGGVSQTQLAFCHAAASKVYPLQQMFIQIAPLIVYAWVFGYDLSGTRWWLASLGVVLILFGALSLGRAHDILQLAGYSA